MSGELDYPEMSYIEIRDQDEEDTIRHNIKTPDGKIIDRTITGMFDDAGNILKGVMYTVTFVNNQIKHMVTANGTFIGNRLSEGSFTITFPNYKTKSFIGTFKWTSTHMLFTDHSLRYRKYSFAELYNA